MSFRSGWCGLTAQPWSHGRCAGSSPKGSACVCSCHRPGPPETLDGLLDLAVLEQLVAVLDRALSLPGVVHPAAYRLRAAAVELVAELTETGMSTRAIAPVVGVHHDTVASDLKASAPVGNPTRERPSAEDRGGYHSGPSLPSAHTMLGGKPQTPGAAS